MFDLVVQDSKDRALLVRILRELQIMGLRVEALNAAVTRNTAAVDALVASHEDPAGQAAVDAAVVALENSSAKAESAVAAPIISNG